MNSFLQMVLTLSLSVLISGCGSKCSKIGEVRQEKPVEKGPVKKRSVCFKISSRGISVDGVRYSLDQIDFSSYDLKNSSCWLILSKTRSGSNFIAGAVAKMKELGVPISAVLKPTGSSYLDFPFKFDTERGMKLDYLEREKKKQAKDESTS